MYRQGKHSEVANVSLALCRGVFRSPRERDPSRGRRHSFCANTALNPDIGGVGTLVGVYVPVLLVWVSLAIGRHHRRDSGTKEVGTVVLANLAYLTFNLFKSIRHFSDLSFADRLIAFMSIDASHGALTMTLSNKEALAARTYVILCSIVQSLSLTALAAALIVMSIHAPDVHSCCQRQVWWASIDSCEISGPLLWLYLAYRLITWLHDVRVSFQLAPHFDRLKKEGEAALPISEGGNFDDFKATTLTRYAETVPIVLVNFASLLALLLRMDLQHRSGFSNWGQSATLLASLFGGGHWLYTCLPIIANVIESIDVKIQNAGSESAFRVGSIVLRELWRAGRRAARWSGIFCKVAWTYIMPTSLPLVHSVELENLRGTLLERASELRAAAKLGDVQGVLHHLGRPCNGINVPDERGNTALMLAIKGGSQNHREVCRTLLDHGACVTVNSYERKGRELKPLPHVSSPLHVAAARGEVGILSDMLVTAPRAYRYIDTTGRTVLDAAVDAESEAAVKLLVSYTQMKQYPPVTANDWHYPGFPYVLTASIVRLRPSLNIIRLLVDKAIITRAILRIVDADGLNILQLAFSRHIDWAFETEAVKVVRILHMAGLDLKHKDRDGSSLIHYAAMQGSIDLIYYLQHEGLDINALNKYGQTPLHDAVCCWDSEIVRRMIELGAGVDGADEMCATPLEEVLAGEPLERLGTVKTLLNAGASPNRTGIRGWRPLFHATVQSGESGVLIDLLVEHGATPLSAEELHRALKLKSSLDENRQQRNQRLGGIQPI